MAELSPQNFTMHSGDDFTLEVTVRDGNGAVINVSALNSAIWKLSKKVTSPVILSKTLGAGITVIDGPNGRLNVTLLQADTASLSGDFYHEMQIVESSNKKTTVMIGTPTIVRDLITE